MKFGGSSVGSAEAFRRTSALLGSYVDAGHETVAVVSAMYGVTNRLLHAATAASERRAADVSATRAKLFDLHASTARDVISSPEELDVYLGYLQATMAAHFDAVCRRLDTKGAQDAYDSDCISSVGERWSSALLTGRLRSTGRRATLFEADALIVTDEESGNARPILDASRARVQATVVPAIEGGAIAVVPGFMGVSVSGKLTTLGRGGSDLTAAVLGHCVDADEVALWKVEHTVAADGWMGAWVAGWEGVVHDADPSLTIASLRYEEAAELAHFGKKVLHPETVMPAVEKAIPIAVRNSLTPSHAGTVISRGGTRDPSGAACTAAAAAAAARPTAAGGSGGGGRVLAVTRVPLRTYETRNGPLVDLQLDAHRAITREEAALVVLVGAHVMDVPGLPRAVEDVLRAAGIPAHVPAFVNGSRHNFTIAVPGSRRNEAVALLHKRFVGGDGAADGGSGGAGAGGGAAAAMAIPVAAAGSPADSGDRAVAAAWSAAAPHASSGTAWAALPAA